MEEFYSNYSKKWNGKYFNKNMMRFAVINTCKKAFNLQYINSNARVVYVGYNYYNLCPLIYLWKILFAYTLYFIFCSDKILNNTSIIR